MKTKTRPPWTPGRIRRLRDRLGLTQTVLGRLVGVGRMSVTGWEVGRNRPSRAAQIIMEQLETGLDKKIKR